MTLAGTLSAAAQIITEPYKEYRATHERLQEFQRVFDKAHEDLEITPQRIGVDK